MQYIEEQTGTTEPISIDSDRESNKSDNECDPVPTKEQDMFIWNPDYQVSIFLMPAIFSHILLSALYT